jgi:hypothetical protein
MCLVGIIMVILMTMTMATTVIATLTPIMMRRQAQHRRININIKR